MPFATQTATVPVILLSQDARTAFLRRTYAHLLAAVLGFVAFEYLLFSADLALPSLGKIDPRRMLRHRRCLSGYSIVVMH